MDLERLEDTKYLKHSEILFKLSFLSAKNGLHYPFQKHFPEREKLEEELKLRLKLVKKSDYINIINLVDSKELLIEFSKLSYGNSPINQELIRNFRILPNLKECFELEKFLEIEKIEKAKNYVVKTIGNDFFKIHNLYASTILCEELIKKVIKEKTPVEELIIKNAPVKTTLRRNKDQIILIDNQKLAIETNNLKYVFGQGGDERQCPFALFFIPFLKELRIILNG